MYMVISTENIAVFIFVLKPTELLRCLSSCRFVISFFKEIPKKNNFPVFPLALLFHFLIYADTLLYPDADTEPVVPLKNHSYRGVRAER